MTCTTSYLGLSLPHPLLAGASPLTADLDVVLRLEDAGAAAIVMHSLFEEQIVTNALRRSQLRGEPQRRSTVNAGAGAYAQRPDEYLEHFLRVKARVRVPVIASLNGTTAEGWLQYARALKEAGADALELNFYHLATDPAESGAAIEERLIDIVAVVKESVRIPVSVKLSPFYSSIPNMAARLEVIGANGLVLFNRFYQADIDPETGGPMFTIRLSDSSDLPLRLHAIASVAHFTRLSLAVSGGVHEGVDVVKSVMAGADAVQVASALLRHGPSRLAYLRRQFEAWLEQHRYESLAQLKASAALARERHPASVERREYLSVLQSWTAPVPENH